MSLISRISDFERPEDNRFDTIPGNKCNSFDTIFVISRMRE